MTVTWLDDGSEIHLRPIRRNDAKALQEFHRHLSSESIRRRWFTAHPELTIDEAIHFTNVDGDKRNAVVAVYDGELVGVGRYETLTPSTDAECAFVVRDDFQRHGLGTALVKEIMNEARRHGKRRLVAETLPDNVPMIHAFRRAAPDAVMAFADGVVEVTVSL
jgi:RimJ/RimL family protein N-acetyltransferase